MEVNDKVLNTHFVKNNLNKRDSKTDGKKRRVKEKREEISEEQREIQMNNLMKWREKMNKLENREYGKEKEYRNGTKDGRQNADNIKKERIMVRNTVVKEEINKEKKINKVGLRKKDGMIDKKETITGNIIENLKTDQIINRIENGNREINGLEIRNSKEGEIEERGNKKDYKIDREKMEEIRREIKKSGLKKEYNPYEHQIEAIGWMRKTIEEGKHEKYGIKGGILHMSMGLGKTLTTLLHCLLKRKKGEGPTLIVCSKSLMPMWEKDGVKKFFEEKVKCLCMHREYVKENVINLDFIMSFDFIITTYDFCLSVFNKGNYKYNVYQCRNSSDIKYPTSRLRDLYENNRHSKITNKNSSGSIDKKSGYKINYIFFYIFSMHT